MIHFFVCVFYKAFPVHIEWWVVTCINIVIMAGLGEFICMKRETLEIPVIVKQGYNLVNSNDVEQSSIEVVEEEEPPLANSDKQESEQIIVIANNRVKSEKEQA